MSIRPSCRLRFCPAQLSARGPQQAKTFSPETYKIKLADAYAKVGITLGG